ncbi:uncharacterized protein LOC106074809 [Biomphalaria glabrata]|uniref:Uncharacterized protein LOC106074809 n=1 Tax=Biomphalaria glabrata TaxID=6526 RepID=A0A9W2ZHV1_BIOGL|nr:uncharacterized protein LOC106074809 [Biomphalaria glabrata]
MLILQDLCIPLEVAQKGKPFTDVSSSKKILESSSSILRLKNNVSWTTEASLESENFDKVENFVTKSKASSFRDNVGSLESFQALETSDRGDYPRVESLASHTASALSGFESLLRDLTSEEPNGSTLTNKSSSSDSNAHTTSSTAEKYAYIMSESTTGLSSNETYNINRINESFDTTLGNINKNNKIILNSTDNNLTLFLSTNTEAERSSRYENFTSTLLLKYSCPFRCNKGQMSKSAGFVGGEESLSHYCRYCKCEKQKCEVYDMCCPDFSEPYLNQSKSLLNLNESVSNFTSGKERFRIDCKPDQPMMIRSCQPRTESNMTVVELCESDRLINVETVTAVFDNVTKGGILPEQRESLTTFLLNFDADSYMAPEEPGTPLVFYRAYCSAGEWSSPDFQQWLSKLNVEYNITADVFNLTSHCQDVSLYFTASPCKVKLNARLLGPDNVSRDEFESLVLEYFVNGSITLEEELGAYFTLETLYTTSWKSALVDFITMNESVLDVSRDSTYIKSAKYGSKIAEELLIEMTNLLRCGHVTFNKSEYLLNVLGSGLLSEFKLTINLNVTKVTLSEAKDLNYILLEESGELKVCLEILENKLKEIQEANKFWRRNSNAALYVVSLTCSVVSLVCLVLTISTYLIHPVLRTFAGKNNMMLSLSLLLAQTSLLAAAHMEYTGNVCTFLGMSTHFLWLWMFSWTFICSLDMFLVFTAKTRRSCCENEFKSFIKRCLISVVLPMTVVSVVVVVTYIRTSGQDIGYGSMRCYLDSIVSTGVALAGPLFTIVFCNTIFFVTTVVKIHKVRQLKTSDLKKEEQSDLIVYVKLSAMTGVFWLLATIAQVSQNKYFQFIVEPINGLQGVYIFMSYVCNRRVLRLFLRKEEVKATKTSSMSVTTKETEKQN